MHYLIFNFFVMKLLKSTLSNFQAENHCCCKDLLVYLKDSDRHTVNAHISHVKAEIHLGLLCGRQCLDHHLLPATCASRKLDQKQKSQTVYHILYYGRQGAPWQLLLHSGSTPVVTNCNHCDV